MSDIREVLSQAACPFSLVEQEPFICCRDSNSGEDSPLCWRIQLPLLDCISKAILDLIQMRCFFRGGDRTPPSSLSDEDARLAALHP